MSIYKYVLLGTALFVTQPSVAAVIKLGPGCNMYQAIQAANTDRRVGKCARGRGPDKIVGSRFSNPTKTFPTIRSDITIEALQGPNFPNVINTLQFGLDRNLDRLFVVGRRGKLTIGSHVNVLSAVDVDGHLVLRGGAWISQNRGCTINAFLGSRVEIDDANVDTTSGCGIGLNGATMTANKLDFFGNSPPIRPTVGIQAIRSEVTVSNSVIADAFTGVQAQTFSTVTLINTEFPGVDQAVVADGSSVVVAPPAPPPPPPPEELAPPPEGQPPPAPPNGEQPPPIEGPPPATPDGEQSPPVDQQPPVEQSPPTPDEGQPPPPADEIPPPPDGEQPPPDNGSASGEPPQESLAPDPPPASEQPYGEGGLGGISSFKRR